ncbi:cell division protein ZipA [Cupriavidus sp. SK-3]|uniref:AAA family ATPase n=1 Tax=Cupriavidus sp. SK-3 TaxID=1470558 RepID=UPI00044ED03E|nr:ATP-binding protein [Cupriavidus sp. SK-3]KDP84597.1 cell division protein ZipA [Cupriavidus sp. SK-3]
MQPHNPGPVPASRAPATLYMVCGKIGAGKSTLANQLAARPETVLISEDDWLSRLYPGEIRAISDYVRCAGRLRDAMAGHIEALLLAGMSVVLDFPANTPASRSWARALFEQTGGSHQLHYLDVPDAVCKARLRARNASGTHAFETSDAQFDEITRYFVAPSDSEGFHVIRHELAAAAAAAAVAAVAAVAAAGLTASP